MRRFAISVAAVSMSVTLAGCGMLDATGGTDDASPAKGDDITVGLLLPEKANTRYEQFDYPIFKKKVEELTSSKGKVEYANAEADADKQAGQMQRMIDKRVDVIVLDAVDAHGIAESVAKAKDAGIPVIAYDRLAEGPIDAYVSHDNELVGQVQGRALVNALGEKAQKKKVVMMNGEPADPNTALFKKGALGELNGAVDIAASYDTKKWLPEVAAENMRKALKKVGAGNVAAVYSANDGMAGAVIEELQAAGLSELPPVTGQDADLEAVRRVVSGTQYMTVYKSFLLEATGAADMAVAKVQDRAIQFDALAQDTIDSRSQQDIPAMLVPVVALTRENIEDTVIADGVYTVKDICTAEHADDCEEIGLTG